MLEIAVLPGKGRGYRATEDITAGTTIHVSEPLTTTVSQEWIPETCFWCFNFSYPKKQKFKAVSTREEQLELSNQWLSSKEDGYTSKGSVTHAVQQLASTLVFKDILFCSETCREEFKRSGLSTPFEWYMTMAANYRLDNEFKRNKLKETNLIQNQLKDEEIMIIESLDIHDDKALSDWLDEAWSCIVDNDFELYREIDDTDRAMCRLIASCIIRKDAELYPCNDNLPPLPRFKDLLAIQNNELSHFRSCFINPKNELYPSHDNQKSISSSLLLPCIQHIIKLGPKERRELLLSVLPLEVLDVMALYSFFARAFKDTHVTKKNSIKIPTLANLDHRLFRSIYFRERANSFGLWEMSHDHTDVTDDLELLGWGIYPSAVYFNHSCDANVIKIRDGRKMKFIAKRMIKKGEEACISYGNVEEDVENRRSRLLKHYHFLCQCTRCIQEDEQNNNNKRSNC
ncbi:uncharacterized protein BX663DRAFT_496153 [Cokeromyces recurvatus]|uniref:uncharacterized protein n=1 Tax=Cokeromyces recurvatus TaxID=90255 RepID=UPI00221EEE72|nr:uncharacterized protein BX663DRAFT_496153 [Cokeromyces recurvatus]KAI7906364.1 hypothetical protein BX663DRAFT_496153 [Cokeromyces recurvatus]